MANWTQQEMEELMEKMTKKAMTDAAFRKEVLADATKALEKLAGKPLPEGSSLKCVEKDPNYQTTLVLPDLIDEEKLDDESLSSVAGGISAMLIVSVCVVAAGVGPDVAYCNGKACAADVCALHSAGGGLKACGGQACIVAEADTLTTPISCSGQACAKYRD